MLSLWGYVLEGDLGVGVYPNERERGRTDLTSTAFAAIKRSWLENRQRNKMQSSPSLSSSDNSPSVHAEHTDYHMLRFLERQRERGISGNNCRNTAAKKSSLLSLFICSNYRVGRDTFPSDNIIFIMIDYR